MCTLPRRREICPWLIWSFQEESFTILISFPGATHAIHLLDATEQQQHHPHFPSHPPSLVTNIVASAAPGRRRGHLGCNNNVVQFGGGGVVSSVVYGWAQNNMPLMMPLCMMTKKFTAPGIRLNPKVWSKVSQYITRELNLGTRCLSLCVSVTTWNNVPATLLLTLHGMNMKRVHISGQTTQPPLSPFPLLHCSTEWMD